MTRAILIGVDLGSNLSMTGAARNCGRMIDRAIQSVSEINAYVENRIRDAMHA
jgi:hypothetical protein